MPGAFASSGVGPDPLEEWEIANDDTDGTIVIAVIITVIPVNVIWEVHANGAVAMSTGQL